MKPSFESLRAAYPYDPILGRSESAPCRLKNGAPAFVDQCAIRVGVALVGAGVLPASGAGGLTQCWHGHKGQGHTLRVEELVRWLATPGALGPPSRWTGKDPNFGAGVLKQIWGKRGILAMMNFWGRGSRGDHIDLWAGVVMLSGNYTYVLRCKDFHFWELP